MTQDTPLIRILTALLLLLVPASAQTPGTFVPGESSGLSAHLNAEFATKADAAATTAALALKADAATTTAALALKADLTNPVIVGANSAVLYCTNYVSLQACHDALPSTGGRIILAANTTYTLTARLNITKANTTVECPSWGTILKRDATLTTTQIVLLNGAGDVIRDCTIDGNSVASATADLEMSGANGLVWHVKAINGNGVIQIALDGANSRLAYSTVTGISPNANKYGVWAINHVQVTIDHNTISGAGIDGIGADGAGSIIANNTVSGCHCLTSGGGGQIVAYPLGSAMTIVGNTIGAGCSPLAGGIEISADNITVASNSVFSARTWGIAINATATNVLIAGNTVLNSGQITAAPGITVQAGSTDFQIVNNQLIDNQGSPTQTWGVQMSPGAADRYQIANNVIRGNLTGTIDDKGTGIVKAIRSNGGIDDEIPSVASAATLALPLNPTISLTGVTGVTAISGDAWVGRTVTMIPVGIVAFTAGATIANSVTTVASVPLTAIYNGTNWNLR